MDRYAAGLTSDSRPKSREVPVELGMVLEDVQSDWVGEVIRVEKSGGVHLVVLEDRHRKTRSFPLGPGFWLDGEPVILTPPRTQSQTGLRRTASGGVAVPNQPAQVAKASRIWVEGTHDAELVEKIWGSDLRHVGIVVEPLSGVDNLLEELEEFGPSPDARIGVLVDHLVPGSKEDRIAQQAMRSFPHTLVLGHPFIDIWQAVRPERVGLKAWPHVPRGTDIKVGTLTALGWPAASQADIAHGWQRILSQVRDYRDLDPELLGPVEQLIDFVTEESSS